MKGALMGLFKRNAKPELRAVNKVWDRACVSTWPPAFGQDAPEGDRRLPYMILFDGFAQDDGLLDAMSHFGSEGTRQAIEAFRWFGLPAVADVVQETWDQLLPPDTEWTDDADLHFDVLDIESMTDTQSDAFDEKYQTFEKRYHIAAEDLQRKLGEFYGTHPELFAPPSD
jgi:hypothetical protein